MLLISLVESGTCTAEMDSAEYSTEFQYAPYKCTGVPSQLYGERRTAGKPHGSQTNTFKHVHLVHVAELHEHFPTAW